MKQIQELISDEVTELLLLLLLLLSLFLLLLLIMLISLLFFSLLERMSFHFVNVYVWRRRFSKVCIKFSMFKLSLAIISPLMHVAPLFEQTLISHTQGLLVCNI